MHWHKKILFILTLSLTAFNNRASAVENPLFAYTHLLPSPFTLSQGRLVLGTSVAYGLTDFFQIGTDILRDFYKIYNINVKLGLLDFEDFAMALTLSYESYNYKNIDSSNPNIDINSWQPGLVTSYSLAENLAFFVGGHLNFTESTLRSSGIKKSGYIAGAVAETDLSWAYNPHKKSIGSVLSVGATYDFTYYLYGIGISHHWNGFHLGVHYYPDAEKNQLLPIISGGMSIDTSH